MLEKKVFVGMNKDNPAKDLRPEEYRHAVNLVAVTDGVGTSTRLENMLGMRETGMPVSVDGICIGLWNYREGNKIYGFYQGSTDFILEYDGVLDEATVLMQNNLLDFDVANPVHDVFYIDGLLYFNDGLTDGSGHSIRKINIDYAKTGALNTINDERALSLIKTPPLRSLTLNRKTDTNLTLTRPRIRLAPLQFASRYVYDDDEVSVISPISNIAPPVDWDFEDNHWNYVEVVFSIDNDLAPIINRVELLVREGNDGLFFIYDEFQPEDFIIDNADGTKSLEYDVYLDRSGATLSEQEVGTSAESVPRLSGAMELMENRMFLTSSLEEYNVFLDDWDCIMNISVDAAASSKLDDEVYQPAYYKENSYYTWGVVFMDDFGRKSAPVVRKNMVKQTPNNLSPYGTEPTFAGIGLLTGQFIYNHPDQYLARPTMSGKPPVWATRYQFARSTNQSYNDWFKARFLVKPLVDPNRKTEDPTTQFSNLGWYLENGYWYQSIHHTLTRYRETSGASQLAWGGNYFDLFIPDGFPIAIDRHSLIRIAFDYAKSDDTYIVKKEIFSVIQVEEGRVRIQGLAWIDMKTVFLDDVVAVTGVNLVDGKDLFDDETFLHFEVLNPIGKNRTPLLYETGKVYDVVNAGLPNRAFNVSHNSVGGDCYHTAYQEMGGVQRQAPDGSSHSLARSPLLTESTARINRDGYSISYSLKSPITDRQRAGEPIDEGLAEGELEFISFGGTTNIETGLYNKTKHNSRGRVTVEVPNQKELERGSQVRFSRTFIQDSLINGLSNFPEENKHAISSDRGDIVKLVATNERVLVAIHTRSMTSLYINQRFINSGEGEAFLAQTDRVIGDDRKLLLNLGTTHPESVVSHDSRIYGFDSIMSEPWRRSQDGITPLALTFGMKTYFEEKGEIIRKIRTIDPSAIIKVLGGYDQWLDMYVLTFSKIEYVDNGDPITIEAETIGFSERVKRWVSFYSFKPEYYSSIMNNLVSAKDQSLWRHMDTADRNLFYGDYYASSITINANESNDVPKIYQNLGVSSTERWSMTCKTIDGKESLLTKSNFILRDNIFYAEFLRDKNTDSGGLTGNQTPLLHGEKMIGETLEITLTNDNSDRVTLDAVYVGYSPMAGHLLSQT